VQIRVLDGPVGGLTARAVVYGSILCAGGPDGREALRRLLAAYVREAGKGVLFTELRNLSDLSEVQGALIQAGFAYEKHLNYLTGLSPM